MTGCTEKKTEHPYNYSRYYDNKIEFTVNKVSVDKEESENESISSELNLYAKSAVIIDASDGHIIYEKNCNEKLAMASTTKILTAIIALENCSITEVVEVSKNAAGAPKVKLGLKEGEQYYLGDLLYSMMLESHNDSAVAIAEHIGGSEEGFSKIMNGKAFELGLYNSSFVTPNGLDSESHFSTAYEMAILGAYAIKNEEFRKLVNTESHSFSEINNKNYHSVNNINAYLSMDNTAIGIKTGFTNDAGYCFVGANEIDGKIYVSCVLACGWPNNKGYKWADMNKLIDYALDTTCIYDVTFKEIDNMPELENESIRILLKRDESIDVVSEIDMFDNIKHYVVYGNVKRILN